MNPSPLRWWLLSWVAVTVTGGIVSPLRAEPPGAVPNLPNIHPVTPVPPNSPGVQDFRNLPHLLAPALPAENPLATPTEPAQVDIKINQALSLQQALELAVRTNRDLQAARAQIDAARAGLRQAQAALFPSLDFQSNFQRTESAQTEIATRVRRPDAPGVPLANNDGASTTWDGTLRLNYDIYTGGQRGAQIQQAQERLRQAVLNGVQVAQELQLNVSNAYYDVQNAEAQVAIGQSAVRNAEVSLRDAEAQLRAGVGTQFAVLQAQVQLANSQQQLVNALRDQAVAQRNLVQILSLGDQVTVTVSDPIETAGEWVIPLDQSIILGWQQRPELVVQLSQRRFQEAQRELALSGIRPNLSFFAQTDYLRFFESPANLEQGGFGQGYVFGLQLRFTLFDGGAAFAGARQAEANVAVADITFANVRNQVRFQVEQALSDLRANEANIKTAALALEQANESLRLARLRFQAGVGTQTDVITQENALTQAQGNLVAAVLGYNRALAALERAVGNAPFNFVRQPDQPNQPVPPANTP